MNTPPDAWPVLKSGDLPNGLHVDLILGGSPGEADVAICSSDERGNVGLLNRFVLGAVELVPTDLPKMFQPPTTLLRTTKGHVLVVQTVGSDESSKQLLLTNLALGVESLRSLGPLMTIYLPLLGTGGGGLAPVDSADVTFRVLQSWTQPSIANVQLAVPTPDLATAVLTVWDRFFPQPPVHAFIPERLERHVRSALAAAQHISDDKGVAPENVLRVIIAQTHLSSRAFDAIRNLLPPEIHRAMRARLPPEIASVELHAPIRLASPLYEQLTYAQRVFPELATGVLWGRDLITAALLAGGLQGLPELDDRSRAQLLERWYMFVIEDSPQRRPRHGWDAWWDLAGVPRPGLQPANETKAPLSDSHEGDGPHRAGYFADTDLGKDCLGIEQEAEAFARLILDENVEPPLSIGLLGDWGSGKSFFIEQLKKEINACAGAPGLHKDVVQIEFNAWHVSDGNLWASLVTHIFEQIWKKAIPPGKDAAAARAQLGAEIVKAEGALHQAGAEAIKAQVAVEKAENRRARKLEVLRLARVFTDEVAQELAKEAADAGWKGPLDTLIDVQKTARALATSGERVRMQLSLWLNRLPRALGIALIVGISLWVGLRQLDLPSWFHGLFPRAVEVLAALGSLAGGLLGPLRAAKRRVDKFEESLATTTRNAEQSPEKDKITKARRDLETTEASLVAARARLADLRNQEAALDPARQLHAFLEERVQSTQYRSQQGIISLVHRDFKQLSERMRAWRMKRGAGATASAAVSDDPNKILPIDRIVLYIDDLDRCRPEHVVATLEATHLLLALDLFVVVVAVDSRWLIRALEVQYGKMLADGADGVSGASRRSTAQDYLEKIFQITYALAPMQPDRFGDYVDALTAAPAPRQPNSSGDTTRTTATPKSAMTTTTDGQAGPAVPEGVKTAVEALLGPTLVSAAVQTTAGVPIGPSLSPPGTEHAHRAWPALEFIPDEKDCLKSLMAILPTPRMAKRLVNVYRLIKATRPHVVAGKPQQHAALFLLAVLFGRPVISGELLRTLCQKTPPFDNAETPMPDAVDAYVRGRSLAEDSAEWQRFARQLAHLGLRVTVGDCNGLSEILARYSLVTGHEWHTWSASRPGARTSNGNGVAHPGPPRSTVAATPDVPAG